MSYIPRSPPRSPFAYPPAERRESVATRGTFWSISAISAVIFAVIYNGVLAFLFAHGMPMTTSIVALTEILILAVASSLILVKGFSSNDLVPVAFAFLGIVIGVYMSFANERIFADGARIFAIVAIFVMLGARIEIRWVDRCFLILTSIVLAVLVIELASTTLYVSLFKPAAYYEATRGVEKFFLNKSGLFRNSLGFQGRLSLNPFSDFRTSSIFIEQVSLANYAGALIVYLLTRWSSITRRARLLQGIGLFMILLTNSTRTSIVLALVGLLGYWVYPRLPKRANLLVAPLLLLIATASLYLNGATSGDDVPGRLSKTIVSLGNIGADSLLGLRADLLPMYGDSGYPYLLTVSTILGAIVFWLIVCLILEQRTVDEKRCAWAMALYFFVNLLIGGTAVFSIKVAAPLWLLIGCLRAQPPPVADAQRPDLVR